jgi:putative flavoprotein involved in K+ transport
MQQCVWRVVRPLVLCPLFNAGVSTENDSTVLTEGNLDPSEHHLTTVIWCTGFEGDYSFVQVPGVLNERGQPLEHEGLTEAPGLYFAAVDFSSTRKSGLIAGIAEEAQRLVDHIVARCDPAT